MDINGFREAQSPWFFSQPPEVLVEARASRAAGVKKGGQPPTQDNRFPGWAAPMEDGRLATDYRAHCEVNIPTGAQFASRKFMISNAERLIHASRLRQAEQAGAGLPFDSVTVMPRVANVRCSPAECRVVPRVPEGVGIDRVEPVPELFGTFAPSRPSWGTPARPALTTQYEGGRNTVRGFF